MQIETLRLVFSVIRKQFVHHKNFEIDDNRPFRLVHFVFPLQTT